MRRVRPHNRRNRFLKPEPKTFSSIGRTKSFPKSDTNTPIRKRLWTFPNGWSRKNFYGVTQKAAHISITSDDPDIFEGIDAGKIKAYSTASSKKFIEFRKATMSNAVRWCIVPVPSVNWAKKDFSRIAPTSRLWTSFGTQ